MTRNSELSPSSDHDIIATSMDKFSKKVDDAKNLKTASFQNQLASSGAIGKRAPEYSLEEKMNEGLMAQFKPMFEEEVSIDNVSRDHTINNMPITKLNSVSEFSGYTEPQIPGGRKTDRGNSGSRTQLL